MCKSAEVRLDSCRQMSRRIDTTTAKMTRSIPVTISSTTRERCTSRQRSTKIAMINGDIKIKCPVVAAGEEIDVVAREEDD